MLLLSLLMSAAVHAAVLAALPGAPAEDLESTPVKVLEVALVQAEAPPQLIEQPPPPQPPRRLPERVAKTPVTSEPQRHVDVPAPVLALPEPRAATEPAVTVPAPKPAETRPAPAETKTDVASVAVTPPSFSAAYLQNPPPRYPPSARRSGTQGTVTLKVLVTREGLPGRVELAKSSGSAPLDQAALETVKTWRFAPARRGTESIESTVLVPIVFRLEGTS